MNSHIFTRLLSRNYSLLVWISLFVLLGSITFPPLFALILATLLLFGVLFVAQKRFVGLWFLLSGWLLLTAHWIYVLAYTYLNWTSLIQNPDYFPELVVLPSIVFFIITILVTLYTGSVLRKEISISNQR